MIDLTHVGERLLAAMVTCSPKVRSELAVHLGPSVLRRRAVVEAPLASFGALAFDGASRIDVGLVDDEAGQVLAVEAKLGESRLSRRAFEERFLPPCGVSHGGARVTGSMIAILEGKLPAAGPDARLLARVPAEAGGEGTVEVEPRWALVVRRRTLEGWLRRGLPGLSSRCAVIAFDDLVEAYGGRAAFNALVRELLEVDYFEAWKLGAPAR